jgi:hypothetical protein
MKLTVLLFRVLYEQERKTMKTAEMKFMRHTAGCSLSDQRRNDDIVEELTVGPIENKLALCKQNG